MTTKLLTTQLLLPLPQLCTLAFDPIKGPVGLVADDSWFTLKENSNGLAKFR